MKESKGNFLKDVDGNVVLDLNCGLALGYNHDALVNARDSPFFDRFTQGKTDVSTVPPSDFTDIMREEIMPVAPSGLSQVHLSDGSSTTANEVALSTAIMAFAMRHKKDNYSSLSVMGFEGASHGQSVATLSVSDAKVNVAGVPTYDWPRAPLPKMTYPLAQNERANVEEEDRCLAAAKQMIEQRRADGKDVAAIIIEPISSFKTQQATPRFYKLLRALAADEGIPFVVDETKTGMGQTGKMWAHEHWWLSERDGGVPDMVTFGGKTGISGFFSTYDYRLNPHCASFEQNVDMSQVLGFGLTWKAAQDWNLFELVNDSSSFLKMELGHV